MPPEKSENLDPDSPRYRERVYEIVRRIPAGRVMTYGQIADILGEGTRPARRLRHARADEERDPLGSASSTRRARLDGPRHLPPDKQQRMLEAEGVVFDARGRCDLGRYRWTPEEFADGRGSDEQGSLFGD